MALASFGLHFRAVHRCNWQCENIPQGNGQELKWSWFIIGIPPWLSLLGHKLGFASASRTKSKGQSEIDRDCMRTPAIDLHHFVSHSDLMFKLCYPPFLCLLPCFLVKIFLCGPAKTGATSGAERSPLHHLHPKLTKLQLGMCLASSTHH